MLIIARIDFISEICLIHSHAANGLLESRSRTKSHCPALHKHARTHMQTHTRISLSLLSVLSLQRVSPRCRTQIWKVTACRPCRQRNVSWPIRRGSVPTVSLNNQLQSGCWKHQKKKIIQTEVNTSLTKLLFMSRLSMWVLSLWNCVTQQTELKQMESTVNPALLLSHFAYWSRRLGNAQKALLFDFDSRSSLLANNMHFRGEGEGTQGTRTVRRGRGGFWMFWWWPWHD